MGWAHRKHHIALAAVLTVGTVVTKVWADTIDTPTLISSKPLEGSTVITGEITTSVGFPYHRYTASRDGFVRIEMETQNLDSRPNDNGGVAWRPYLRIISVASDERLGEAWSTNGHQLDPDNGRAELVLRVAEGEQFTVIATLAQNFVKGRPDARASYRLVVEEVSP